MSELGIPMLWFNLRAASPHTTTVWMKKIRQAQVIYLFTQLKCHLSIGFFFLQKQYVLLTNKSGMSIPDMRIPDMRVPHSSNGSDTSLSTYSKR